ncbi:MAG: homoserine kinase [Saprospiraceae bacterium]
MQYTVLNLAEINDFIQQYDIDECTSAKVLSGGSENTNYLIRSKSASYVLTVCEQKTIAEATNLALLLGHLATHDFSTSKVIPTKKRELISVYQNKPVLLKTFLPGTIQPDLSPNLLTLIGIQMGKLHQISAPDFLPKTLSYGIGSFDEVAIYAKDSPYDKWLQAIKQRITPDLTSTLPQALIHSDIFYSNVIISKDEREVVIMDFEEATEYYRIFDVGMAIIGLCRTDKIVDLGKVTSLLQGYVQEVDLTKEEQAALQSFTIYAAAAMSFWRHKNFNYTNPTPAMFNHYLELKKVADGLCELNASCFKNILGRL